MWWWCALQWWRENRMTWCDDDVHCNDDVPGIERFIQHNYADGSYKCFAYNSSRLVGAGRHDVCCHTCTHTNIHVQTTTHTHTHKHIHTHTHTRIHTHAHIHIHTQTHTRTNNQTHTRTHIHIHTYTHTHTHTHKHPAQVDDGRQDVQRVRGDTWPQVGAQRLLQTNHWVWGAQVQCIYNRPLLLISRSLLPQNKSLLTLTHI
jgi:hypothetical protein